MEQDTIRTRRIELIDQDGTTKAILEAGRGKGSGVVLGGVEEGSPNAAVAVNDEGEPFLLLESDADHIFAALLSTGPKIRLRDKAGNERIIEL
jgi:hypothetical protein